MNESVCQLNEKHKVVLGRRIRISLEGLPETVVNKLKHSMSFNNQSTGATGKMLTHIRVKLIISGKQTRNCSYQKLP